MRSIIRRPGCGRTSRSHWSRRRAALSLLSIQACILASVAVCTLVAVALVAQLYAWRAGPTVTVLMLSAMSALVADLLCFLAEATLARTDLPGQ